MATESGDLLNAAEPVRLSSWLICKKDIKVMRNFFFAAPLLALITPPAAAEPSQGDVDAARSACRDAFLARDADAYTSAAASMIAWGPLQNPDWSKEVELCLAFAGAIEGADLSVARTRAASMVGGGSLSPISGEEKADTATPTAETDTQLTKYLARVGEENADMDKIVSDIVSDSAFTPASGPDRDALETAISNYARPIPASQAERNLRAYEALARINPENPTYKERAARYEQAIAAEREQLAKTARQLKSRLVRTTAEFDGSSWARHPSSPRYQDIRNYVTLYLLETASGQQTMELFFNYTSRNGWLFVESASINIDGETSQIPAGQWLRDNDTEIWEFAGIRGPIAETLARKIAESKRAVVRFNGQQFYDDYVVSDADKRIMREMLAMWDVISKE
ncbi:hypothetical protein [Rhodobacter aestuarii]|nr:hypothetical protein [Rhodobacter aestuarii]